MPKPSARGSTTPDADAEAWARATRRRSSRHCVTCAWGQKNPQGANWLSVVLQMKASGDTTAAFEMIVQAVRERWPDFLHTDSALRAHYRRCVLHE